MSASAPEAAFAARLAAIDAAPMQRTQIVVVLLCFVLNLLDGVDIVLLTYAAPVIAREWDLRDGALGIVLTAGLVGMALGSVAMGAVADRLGRRTIVLVAIVLIAIGMLMAGHAADMTGLIVWRVVTGSGIGAILASMAAIASEFANARNRTFCVTFLQAGWPIGAIITGFTAAALIETQGWRPLFTAAGLMSVAILPVVAAFMRESLVFLARRPGPGRLERMNQLLARLGQPPLEAEPPPPPRAASAPGRLFRDGRARDTLALWLGMGMGWAALYFLISWIPRIAVGAGLPLDQAILAGTTFNVGAFAGSVAIGLMATRVPLTRLIPLFLGTAAILMPIFGWSSLPIIPTFALILVLGILVQGGFNAFYPLAAQLYPTEIRTTGIGLAMAVGRSGAILGPLAAGYMMQAGIAKGPLFLTYALPLAVAALACRTIRLDFGRRPES